MKRILFWTVSIGLTQLLAVAIVAMFWPAPAKARHELDNAFRNAVLDDQLGLFVVNPDRTSGTRFLTVELAMVLDAPQTVNVIEGRKSVIRDIVLQALRSETIKTLRSSGETDRLEKRIVDSVNAVLRSGRVLEVCITRMFQQ